MDNTLKSKSKSKLKLKLKKYERPSTNYERACRHPEFILGSQLKLTTVFRVKSKFFSRVILKQVQDDEAPLLKKQTTIRTAYLIFYQFIITRWADIVNNNISLRRSILKNCDYLWILLLF